MTAALLSTFHLLALALGLPGVFLRGRALRRLANDPAALGDVLTADALWGVAALLWLVTGLTRAFAGFEKGTAFYLANGAFLVKLGLFGVVFALEAWPMVAFITWRAALAKGRTPDTSRAPLFARLNDAELALTLVTPFFASMMARGLGMGWFT